MSMLADYFFQTRKKNKLWYFNSTACHYKSIRTL